MDPKLIKAVRSQINNNKEDQDLTLEYVVENGAANGSQGFTYLRENREFALKNAELIFDDLIEFAGETSVEPIRLLRYSKGDVTIDSWDCFLQFMALYALERVASEETGADILSGQSPRARKNPSHGEQENIYESLVAAGVPIDHYESTLYAKVTPVSKAIVAAANHSLRKTITTFMDNIDKKMWYDIPFAYSPFWEKKKR